MRIFADTNIISEFLEERSQVNLVDRIFEKCEQAGWTRILSVGSFYTITFLTERFLRHQGIRQPQLADIQREILDSLLQVFEIQDMEKNDLKSSITNPDFLDLEDSYQYQCALKSHCDVLLTINKKDFKEADTKSLKILTPQEFIDNYL